MIVFFISTVDQCVRALAESQTFAVKVQDTVWVFLLGSGVDLFVVRVHIEPRFGLREAGIFRIIPLDRRAGRITARDMDPSEAHLL